MVFDPGTAQPDAPSFDPKTAVPSDSKAPPSPSAGQPGSAPTQDWKSLYGGLEPHAQAITSSPLGSRVDDPKETAARNINQAFVQEQLGKNGPRVTPDNWEAIKGSYSSVRFGTSSVNPPSDKELYGMIGKNVEGLTDPEGATMAKLSIPFKELPKAPDIGLPLGDPRTQWLAIYNGLRPLLNSVETPLGVATLGTSAFLGPIAKASVAARVALAGTNGAFTAMMFGGTKEAYEQMKQVDADPKATDQEKMTAKVAVISSGLATLLSAYGTVHAALPDAVPQLADKPIQEHAEIIKDAVAKAEDLSPEKEQAALNAAQQIESMAKTGQPDAPPAPPEGGDKPQYGIAARVSDVRGAAGQIEAPEPGEGIAPEASVERGRKLIEQGADPEAILSDFDKTKRFNSDDFAVVRAKGEDLAQAADQAVDKFGANSDEAKAARQADSDWTARIKPMQTEWAKAGAAQQGSTDIDTGSFSSLSSAFKEISGRDFTPEEAGKAQEIADGVKGASHDAEEAKKPVLEEIEKKAPKGKAEPGSVSDIWQRAKDMLESGEDDFDDIRHKIAADTGLPLSEVTKKLAGPKRMRVITNDMYSKMALRRDLISQANHWLKQQAMPGWQRLATAIPRAFFQAKVFGHGTVGMITHAGINMFDPTEWGTYWPEFIKQYKMIGWHDQGAFHERAMQDLARDKNYVTARRAGLANDVRVEQDDYQKAFMGKLGLTGVRGFDTLKTYRQARFNQSWNALTPDMRTPEMAKLLADDVNHSTGYVKANIPGGVSTALFAPKLEGARWAFLLGDTARDLKIGLSSLTDKATPEQKAIALADVKRKAIIAGTYLTLLAANQGLLEATDSKEKINFKNPLKPDYLAFKVAGHQIGIISPTIGLFRYLASMLHASIETRGGSELKDSRAQEQYQLTGKYIRSKLSPFASVAEDVNVQADYAGRPLPWSGDKLPSYLKREGQAPYTYKEYIGEHVAPIPVEDAIKEVWSNQGMSNRRINDWLAAFATFAIVGGTGARVEKDTALEDQQKPAKEKKAKSTRDPNTSFR